MKYAILTASANHKGIKEPSIHHIDADYYCFSDNPPKESIWKIGEFYDFSIDPLFKHRMNAKLYKILSFLFAPGYDYYFWVDCTHMVQMKPSEIVDLYLKESDIAVFKHPERNCLYQEGEKVKQLNYDYHVKVDAQINYYKQMGYPENNGLYELPAFVYRNTSQIRQLMMSWWENINKFSSRDQISFPYVCYKLGIIPSIMPGLARDFNGIMPSMWRL